MAHKHSHSSSENHEHDPFAPTIQQAQHSDPAAVYEPFRSEAPEHHHQAPIISPGSNNPFLRSVSPRMSYRSSSSSILISSPISPWAPTSTIPKPAPLQRHASLGDYFLIDETPRTHYTDQEFVDIARLLREVDRESWSRVPRIYTVLRLIGQITAIDLFLDQGMNDLWLPFNVSQLPTTMSVFYRQRFVESQDLVLTKALHLETSSVKRHTHFKPGEPFPLTIGDKLGQGGYASVDKVFSPLSGRAYARKIFRRTKAKPSDVQSFMTELQILQRINHHHCVELVASYTDSKYFGLLMSPVADCNLSTFYDVVADNEVNRKILRTFFGCLAHALLYLHQNQIRHRDIKPENILVKGSAVYLADFGISLDWENLSRSTTTDDTGKSWIYCAPEVAKLLKRNSSSDIWSLGCVFLEMLTAVKGSNIRQLREVLRKRTGRPRFYENLDTAIGWAGDLNRNGPSSEEEVVKWIREMMLMEPSSRVTAQSLATSIVQFEKRCQSKGGLSGFCGECCYYDHGVESSSEAASDDVAWAELNTPVTSPPITDDAKDPPGSMVYDNATSRADAIPLAISGTQSDLEELQLNDARREDGNSNQQCGPTKEGAYRGGEEAHSAVDPIARDKIPTANQKGTKLLDFTKVNTLSNLLTNVIPSSSTRPTAEEKASSSQSMGQSTTQQSQLQSEIEPNSDAQDPTALPDHETIVRQELIKNAISNHQPWPSIGSHNRLPRLRASSWRSPIAFLNSVKSDVKFMDYLRSIDTARLERFKAAGFDDLVPMIYLLLSNGLDINDTAFEDELGATPLMWSLHENWNTYPPHKEIAKLLIGFGARVDCSMANGSSPLTRVCETGNIEVLQILAELGEITKSAKTFVHWTPMGLAARNGHHSIIAILIKSGVDFRALACQTSYYYNRPAGVAASAGFVKVIDVLLEHGLGVDEKQGEKNWRMIHLAASNGDADMVKYLLLKGADPTRRVENSFRTPLSLAKSSGNLKTAKVIEDAVKEWKQKKMQSQ